MNLVDVLFTTSRNGDFLPLYASILRETIYFFPSPAAFLSSSLTTSRINRTSLHLMRNTFAVWKSYELFTSHWHRFTLVCSLYFLFRCFSLAGINWKGQVFIRFHLDRIGGLDSFTSSSSCDSTRSTKSEWVKHLSFKNTSSFDFDQVRTRTRLTVVISSESPRSISTWSPSFVYLFKCAIKLPHC